MIERDADKELKGLRKYTNEKKPVDEIVSSMMSAVEKM